MKYKDLQGQWQLVSNTNNTDVHSGAIPGSVYSFLIEDGTIGEPHWRDNELTALELMHDDWTFFREFFIDNEFDDCDTVTLNCKGLDTLCKIFINGTYVGEAYNMHRSWSFCVTSLLQKGSNRIEIVFPSPIAYIKEKDKEWHVGGSLYAMRGFPHLRKAHSMFGWDWGPRLPDAGIFKAIQLVGINSAYLKDITIVQKHENTTVHIHTTVDYQGEAEVEVVLKDPNGLVIDTSEKGSFTIENPQLWWPNGLGEQSLYTIEVRLFSKGNVVDCKEKRVGLRTITLQRTKDQWGKSFAHCVNGLKFFGMGADYIPEDNVLSRITPARTRKLLEQCKRANFNVVRVWGGGYYPSDDFYDCCDELGLVVWQDFMFACANYPLDFEFEENIRVEIQEVIRRIRHHACLGLWCGNNEIEQYAFTEKFDNDHRTRAAYIRIFEHIIPHILQEEDLITPYWPSSPSSGGSFDNPTDPNTGDVHYWKVWHGREPFSAYRDHFFRYVSEFGFQSFPAMATVQEFTLPGDRNIFSRVMDLHQRNEGANGLIMTYLAKTYLYPTNFEVLLYASQLLQAEAVRYGVEHWRRHRGRCMGAIYWQLNDIWPTASWASIDYYGRWKALHYYAKRFFEPIHISCEEYGEMQDKTSIIQEPHGKVPMRAKLNVTNEGHTTISGKVAWQLVNSCSLVQEEGTFDVCVEPFTSVWMPELQFDTANFLEDHLNYQLVVGNQVLSSGTVLFTEPKYYHFKDPELNFSVEDNEIVIHAKRYAKSVEVYSNTGSFVLEDNYFDMEKGKKRIKIVEHDNATFGVRSVYDIR